MYKCDCLFLPIYEQCVLGLQWDLWHCYSNIDRAGSLDKNPFGIGHCQSYRFVNLI